MKKRALGLLIVLFSILALPYWIYIPILFIAIILFPFFWEGILFALLIDVLYGSFLGTFPFLFSPTAAIALIALVVMLFFRDNLRSYV